MATINDYKFNEMSRIGIDHCSLDEVDIQSVKHGDYMLTNHFSNDSTMSSPIEFAVNQPNVFYKGTKQRRRKLYHKTPDAMRQRRP